MQWSCGYSASLRDISTRFIHAQLAQPRAIKFGAGVVFDFESFDNIYRTRGISYAEAMMEYRVTAIEVGGYQRRSILKGFVSLVLLISVTVLVASCLTYYQNHLARYDLRGPILGPSM